MYILDICLLIDLVSNYTREAGVRELERKFGALCRAVAVRVAEKEKGSNGTESSTVSIPFLNPNWHEGEHFLDLILSAEFLSKNFKLFWR